MTKHGSSKKRNRGNKKTFKNSIETQMINEINMKMIYFKFLSSTHITYIIMRKHKAKQVNYITEKVIRKQKRTSNTKII